jgi:hypothetical protein
VAAASRRGSFTLACLSRFAVEARCVDQALLVEKPVAALDAKMLAFSAP